MGATYEIHWDTAAKRLEFTLNGIFDMPTFQKRDAAFRAAVDQAPSHGWTALGDMTNFPPQADAVQQGAEAMMAYSFAHGCTQSVLIAPKAVTTMQTKRLAGNTATKMAFVTTREEALNLLSGN